MKKINFRLLSIWLLAVILVVTLAACNNDKDKVKDPVVPDNPDTSSPVYEDPKNPNDPRDVFFTELYNVSRNIGNEKIEQGKNVYLGASFDVETGIRVSPQVLAADSFALAVNLNVLIDRVNDDGRDSAVRLGFASGDRTIADIYYTVADKMAYAQLGSKKVKVNAKLLPIGQLLNEAMGMNVINSDTVAESPAADNDTAQNIKPDLDALVGALADATGSEWTVDDLINAILTQFGLSDKVLGNSYVQLLGGAENGKFSLRNIFNSVAGAFSASKNGNRYSATLDDSTLIGSQAVRLLGVGDGVGSVDLGISFDTDGSHRLTNGVRISADFKVDSANENVYGNLADDGSGNKLYPYIELRINDLKIKDGTDRSIAPEDLSAYSENLQFQVFEDIAINGLNISVPVRYLQIGMYTNLDLTNDEGNDTELRLYGNVHNDKTHHGSSYTTNSNFFDLIYKDGLLTLTIENTGLIDVMSKGIFPYKDLLAKPVGKFMDAILPEEQRAIFDAEYWSDKSNGTWQTKFKGIAIDHVSAENIIGALMTLFGRGSDSPVAYTAAGNKFKGNIFNLISYAISLMDSNAEAGTLSFGTDSLFDAVINFAKYGANQTLSLDGIADPIANKLDSMGMYGITAGSLLSFNGMEQTQTTKDKLVQLFTDVETIITFDFTDGIKWTADIERVRDIITHVYRATAEDSEAKITVAENNVATFHGFELEGDSLEDITKVTVSVNAGASGAKDKKAEITAIEKAPGVGGYKITLGSDICGNGAEGTPITYDLYFAIDDGVMMLYTADDTEQAVDGKYTVTGPQTQVTSGTNIIWTSDIRLNDRSFEEQFLSEYSFANGKTLPNNRETRFEAGKASFIEAKTAYDEAKKAYADKLAELGDDMKNKISALSAAKQAYETAYAELMAIHSQAETILKEKVNGYMQAYGNLLGATQDNREELRTAAEDANNALLETIEQQRSALGDKYEAVKGKWTNSESGVKKLMETYLTAEKAYGDAEGSEQLDELAVGVREKLNAFKNVTWFYWDLDE